MKKPKKIFMINRDRALEIMWYMDALYDEYKKLSYEMLSDKVSYAEWQITNMYFLAGYRANKVIEKLKESKNTLF